MRAQDEISDRRFLVHGENPAWARLLPAVAVCASLGVSAAWLPARAQESNVVIALVLVALPAVWGLNGLRTAAYSAVVAGAVGFTYFDTTPYFHFQISQQSDAVTALALVLVGMVVAELGVRFNGQRSARRLVVTEFEVVREAANLLASGEELVVVMGTVASKMKSQLGLADCSYEAEGVVGMPTVSRDGTLDIETSTEAGQRPIATYHGGPVALPVYALGQVVGHFVLKPRPESGVPTDRLRAAVTLADQVGAALAAQAPPPPAPEPDTPGARLRVVRPEGDIGAANRAASGARPHPPAGSGSAHAQTA